LLILSKRFKSRTPKTKVVDLDLGMATMFYLAEATLGQKPKYLLTPTNIADYLVEKGLSIRKKYLKEKKNK